FGLEISGNCARKQELSSEMRSAIISKYETRIKVPALVTKFHASRTAIYNTINRWKNHHIVQSLPRSGQPEVLSRCEKR
ncbi:hypothetical protein EJ02DRAFT_326804, partial [Clathrospora elynae]